MGDPYFNLVDTITNQEIRYAYVSNLRAFLDLIPNKIFEEQTDKVPRSLDLKNF